MAEPGPSTAEPSGQSKEEAQPSTSKGDDDLLLKVPQSSNCPSMRTFTAAHKHCMI